MKEKRESVFVVRVLAAVAGAILMAVGIGVPIALLFLGEAVATGGLAPALGSLVRVLAPTALFFMVCGGSALYKWAKRSEVGE